MSPIFFFWGGGGILRKYLEVKFEKFTEFYTSLVVIINMHIICFRKAHVQNQHKIYQYNLIGKLLVKWTKLF